MRAEVNKSINFRWNRKIKQFVLDIPGKFILFVCGRAMYNLYRVLDDYCMMIACILYAVRMVKGEGWVGVKYICVCGLRRCMSRR